MWQVSITLLLSAPYSCPQKDNERGEGDRDRQMGVKWIEETFLLFTFYAELLRWLSGEEPANAGDPGDAGLIWVKIPWKGHGKPLQ